GFAQEADDLLFGKTLLHVQSPWGRELDSKLRCYSKLGGRRKTPSYYMPYLGILAEQRGDSKTALSWFKKAYDSNESQGDRRGARHDVSGRADPAQPG
ncbi:hypothetical protein, partial [Xanthomonas cannabis]|uniref:hypothetical protein n=1 Tax=Xanthomonas cannabis TaxID=1885674 RepID=UPI001F1C348F